MPQQHVVPYTGRIIIRLTPDHTPALRQKYEDAGLPPGTPTPFPTLASAATHLNLLDLQGYLTARAYLTSERLISDRLVPRVLYHEAQAPAAVSPPLRSLLLYYALDPRKRYQPWNLSSLVAQLRELPGVDAAYPERAVKPAGNAMYCPSSSANQEYLDGVDSGLPGTGINVRNLFSTYDGNGIGFVDVELGWYFDHVDLPGVKGGMSHVIRAGDFEVFMGQAPHGTMALGVVLAQHGNAAAFGIARKADFLGCVPHRKNGNNHYVPEAIVAALDRLNQGDILLLEVESADFLPVEVQDEVFDAIRLCVAAKRAVVIEPAGNGAVDLDGWGLGTDAGVARRPLSRDPRWDSGAIVVGACKAAVTAGKHELHDESNYGSRVDASAWGEEVYSPSVSPNEYDCFTHTSAASAIIAGAAILVQQIARTTTGAKLLPWEIRGLLGDLALGTPVVKGRGDTGDSPMPDLGKIAMAMKTLPDIYVRDSLADVGTEPNDMLSQSPDIIITAAPVAAGTLDTEPSWSTMPDNVAITPDRDHFVYVRFRSRNEIAAVNTRVSVFWADTGLGLPPSTWHVINSAPVLIAARPAAYGDVQGPIELAGPILWHPRSNQVPPEHPRTHGCLIAMLDHDNDPAPPPLSFLGSAGFSLAWDDFMMYLGASNNVAFRNFNVVELTASGNEAIGDVEFDVFGLQRQASEMAFEITLRDVPDGITFELHVPPELASAVARSNRAYRLEDGSGHRIRVEWPRALSVVRLARVMLRRGARHRCLARWRVAPHTEPLTCVARLRQFYQGRPVGGLTLELRPRSWRRLRAKREDDYPR